MTNRVDLDFIFVSCRNCCTNPHVARQHICFQKQITNNIIQLFHNLQMKTNEQDQEAVSRRRSSWFVTQGKICFNICLNNQMLVTEEKSI